MFNISISSFKFIYSKKSNVQTSRTVGGHSINSAVGGPLQKKEKKKKKKRRREFGYG